MISKTLLHFDVMLHTNLTMSIPFFDIEIKKIHLTCQRCCGRNTRKAQDNKFIKAPRSPLR
jgi:hypothetical protein